MQGAGQQGQPFTVVSFYDLLCDRQTRLLQLSKKQIVPRGMRPMWPCSRERIVQYRMKALLACAHFMCRDELPQHFACPFCALSAGSAHQSGFMASWVTPQHRTVVCQAHSSMLGTTACACICAFQICVLQYEVHVGHLKIRTSLKFKS